MLDEGAGVFGAPNCGFVLLLGAGGLFEAGAAGLGFGPPGALPLPRGILGGPPTPLKIQKE